MEVSSHSSGFGRVRAVFFLLSFGLVLMGVFSKKGYLDLKRIQNKNIQLQTKIEVVKNKKQELIKQIAKLKTDPVIQEQKVREVLGYVKPGEWVIEFE